MGPDGVDKGHDYRSDRELLQDMLAELREHRGEHDKEFDSPRLFNHDYYFKIGQYGTIPLLIDGMDGRLEVKIVGNRSLQLRLVKAEATGGVLRWVDGPWITLGR